MTDKTQSSKKDKKLDKSSEWEIAASEAKRRLEQCKVYAARLRASLRIFEEKIRAGAPYP